MSWLTLQPACDFFSVAKKEKCGRINIPCRISTQNSALKTQNRPMPISAPIPDTATNAHSKFNIHNGAKKSYAVFTLSLKQFHPFYSRLFNMYKIFSCTAVATGLLLFSCGKEPKYNTPQPIITDTITEPLIRANHEISESERRDIDNFVKRKGWPMTETGTGLRYSVYEPGKGEAIKSGDLVTVDFEITLLNGKLCYTSEETGSEEFVVDHDHVESGLHEAIKYLHVGDKAKIVIPSHLAFGATGDMDKIPPLSPIVYDLTVLDKVSKPGK